MKILSIIITLCTISFLAILSCNNDSNHDTNSNGAKNIVNNHAGSKYLGVWKQIDYGFWGSALLVYGKKGLIDKPIYVYITQKGDFYFIANSIELKNGMMEPIHELINGKLECDKDKIYYANDTLYEYMKDGEIIRFIKK